MSQKARYDDVDNCNFFLNEMLMGTYNMRAVLKIMDENVMTCFKFENKSARNVILNRNNLFQV